MRKILIVDDEPQSNWLLSQILEREGYQVMTAGSGKDALKRIREEPPDIIFLDVKMPEMDGIETLKHIKQENSNPTIIMLSAFSSINDAVTAIRLGAYDYLPKPFNDGQIKIVIEKALREQTLSEEIANLKNQLKEKCDLFNIITASPNMFEIFENIKKVALTDITVLITGESGTGKELLARSIHLNSKRRNAPFIPVDCAIPESLVESELFGYEKGAFTGANKTKEGKFELANRGTLFLDEIGNLPISVQAKLLRALQEREIVRLGSNKPIETDFRLIAATNIDLELAVKQQMFRDDLYYRINQFRIVLPPLKEREGDVLLLAKHFLKDFNVRNGTRVEGFSEEAIKLLLSYSWPGNVRELKSSIEAAAVLAGKVILPEHLPSHIIRQTDKSLDIKLPEQSLPPETPDELLGIALKGPLKEVTKEALQRFEEALILKVLKETNYKKAKAARILGIDYKTLYNKMKQYNLS
ncbi:MAG: sigma-54 dependent transcriptional regulator [Thermodesulfovibrionales bacterium]|nr:sigma-54 dependent transcriptional regulator [Thermodesulfovibrionales bacterium]